MAKEIQKVSWRIEKSLFNQIRELALDEGRSQVWIVERALKEYLSKNNKEPPLATTCHQMTAQDSTNNSNSNPILNKINQLKGE